MILFIKSMRLTFHFSLTLTLILAFISISKAQIIDFANVPKSTLDKDLNNALNKDNVSPDSIINYIRKFKDYPTLQQFRGQHIFSSNDSTFGSIPFKVFIPDKYNPNQPMPLILLLHGAVSGSSFNDALSNNIETEVESDPFYKKLCNSGFIVVMPYGDKAKGFNWAANKYGEDQNLTYQALYKIIVKVKESINIDDNRVFAFGHSDGSDGAFAMDVYQPTMFAGFICYNSMLNMLFTKNLYLSNLINRPLYIVHSDKDDLRPIEQTKAIVKILDSLQVNVTYKEYHGYVHFDKHLDIDFPLSIKFIHETTRNPYPKNIYWEINDSLYKQCDWLIIKDWDLKLPKAVWHHSYNALSYNKKQHNWYNINYYNTKPSAAVKATYKDNSFNINTSKITTLEILINPEMVDLNKVVKVIVNGKNYFSGKIKAEKRFLINQFVKEQDRKAIWVSSILINTKL